jgi:hypothetical protein
LGIVLNRDIMKAPMKELVVKMTQALERVKPEVRKRGYRAAQQSQEFLVRQWARPMHVLKYLEREMDQSDSNVNGLSKEEEEFIRTEKVKLEGERSAKETTVRGRMSKMLLLEDGTLEPLPGYAQRLGEDTQGQLNRAPFNNASLNSPPGIEVEPFVSQQRVRKELNPLSDWNSDRLELPLSIPLGLPARALSQSLRPPPLSRTPLNSLLERSIDRLERPRSTPPRPTAQTPSQSSPSPVGEGFDYLFGGGEATPKLEPRKVKLKWSESTEAGSKPEDGPRKIRKWSDKPTPEKSNHDHAEDTKAPVEK